MLGRFEAGSKWILDLTYFLLKKNIKCKFFLKSNVWIFNAKHRSSLTLNIHNERKCLRVFIKHFSKPGLCIGRKNGGFKSRLMDGQI